MPGFLAATGFLYVFLVLVIYCALFIYSANKAGGKTLLCHKWLINSLLYFIYSKVACFI